MFIVKSEFLAKFAYNCIKKLFRLSHVDNLGSRWFESTTTDGRKLTASQLTAKLAVDWFATDEFINNSLSTHQDQMAKAWCKIYHINKSNIYR